MPSMPRLRPERWSTTGTSLVGFKYHCPRIVTILLVNDHSMILHQPPLALFAFVCAGFAAIILIVYLVRRPPLVGVTKVWLFLGLGVFPIGVAAAGNYQGFEATKERKFCGSCHVMIPHASDSNDLQSGSLASRHARNKLFGDTNCYVCHADYGMYGTIVTKMGGMRHVWLYVTEFRNMSLAEAKKDHPPT